MAFCIYIYIDSIWSIKRFLLKIEIFSLFKLQGLIAIFFFIICFIYVIINILIYKKKMKGRRKNYCYKSLCFEQLNCNSYVGISFILAEDTISLKNVHFT